MTKYERYQLEWMLAHNHSIKDMIEELEKEHKDYCEFWEVESVSVKEVFEEWELNHGFGGEIWACKEEFEDCEKGEL